MPTTIIKTIKADGTGDYTTLAAWVTARKGDLITRDTVEIAEVYGGGNVAEVSLSETEWTTDANHYIWIRAATNNEHPGIFDSTKAYIKGVSTHLSVIIHVPYTRFGPGISVYNNLVSMDGEPTHAIIVAEVNSGGPVVIDGIVAKVDHGITYRIEYCDSSIAHVIKNCVGFQGSSSITGARITNAKAIVYNCTLIAGGAGTGLEADNDNGTHGHPAAPGILISENNYISAGTAYLVSGAGSSLTQGTKDATSTSEATDPSLRNISFTSAGFLNAYTGAGGESTTYEDVHLTSTSILRSQGVDLSAISPTEAQVTVDLDRHSRPATPDIGALQYLSPTTIIKTIKSSGGDYSSLTAWEADRRGNLAIKGTIEVAEVYSGTNNVAIRMLAKDWGTNLQCYPTIRPASGHAHAGIFDSSKAYIKNDTTNKAAFYCEVGNMHLERGLCFENSFYTGGDDPRCIEFSSAIRAGPIFIDGIIMKNAVVKDNNKMLFTSNCTYDPALPHIVKNSVCHTAGGNTSCKGFTLHGTKWKAYNNTIWAFGGFASALVSSGGEVDSENNYLGGHNAYELSGGGSIVHGTNDATEDSSATNPSLRLVLRTTINFKTPSPVGYPDTAPDVHLPTTSILYNAGIDLSSQSLSYLSVATDFEGDPRSTDIGADEINDVPICWNYTAKYKNSTRLFKLSGPGSFPRYLRVPGNIDIVTGKMIDDGREINPNKYDIDTI